MQKKCLLIFAHYYPPDVASTGQILKEQAEGMLEDFNVTVICVVPSYTGIIEERYKKKKYYFEDINGVNVIRVRVPEYTKNNKLSRIKNIIAYFFNALLATGKAGSQDYVFTISQPPVLGGLLGVCAKFLKKAKLIYCIQDFNPEQTIAVGYFKNRIVLGLMMMLDKFSCRQSDLVITVGRDLIQTLENRFKNQKVPKYTMINNWINEKEVYPLESNNENVADFKRKYGLENKFIFMYSGNIGLYYDLENIIKVINEFGTDTKALDGREAVFAFVGAGTVLERLIEYKNKHNMNNVVFIPYQDKDKLIYSLNAADVHWCVNAKGIKGVSCPSKFYGIAAVGKPVLGVLEKGSEIRMLIEESGCGFVSEPGDYAGIKENIEKFIGAASRDELTDMGRKGYEYLVKYLSKDISIKKYSEVIKKL